MRETVGYVVRDATGETQLSIRFTLLQHARQFADQCAMTVRVWRVVRKGEVRSSLPRGEGGP